MHINVTSSQNINNIFAELKFPNKCPMCHNRIAPVFINSKIHFFDKNQPNKNIFSIYFECTFCYKTFLEKYSNIQYTSDLNRIQLDASGNAKIFNVDSQKYSLEPVSFIPRKFENEIINLSPKFVEIYNQSLCAESYKLNEIAGIGYRKAVY